MNGKINNSNKKEAYRDNINNIEHEVVNAMEDHKIKAYIKYINNLKTILFKDNTSETKSNDHKKAEEINVDMPYLETEEEAAENIADIYEHRNDKIKKDDKRKKDDTIKKR